MKALIPFFLFLVATGFQCNEDVLTTSDTYVVDRIPSQCAPQPSFSLGLRSSDGKYYLVDDRTGKFESLAQGDRVEVVYEPSNEVIVCMACTCPAPDGAMIVTKLTKL